MRLLSACLAALAAAAGLPAASAGALTVGGATLYGSTSGGLAGASVSAAGDVNGDGIADVIVGAPKTSTTNAGPARTENGEAFVVFGPFGPHEVISLANLGTRGFRIIGGDWYDAKDHLGTAVAGIGDINGDGFADVAAMADRGGAANTNALDGYAAVIYGGPSTTNVDLHAGIGTRGYVTWLPTPYYAHTYLSVSPAGDVNGDGLADFMFSDPQYYDAASGSCTRCGNGDVYVELGGKASPGPLNAGALGAHGFRMSGSSTRAYLGVAMAPAGDFNGDGVGDLLLGEPGCVPNVVSPCAGGTAYVVYGTKVTPAAFAMPPSAGTGFRVNAPPQSGGMGAAVAAPGDVNGDGRPDLLLGMPYASFLGVGAGNGDAYVVFTPANPPPVIDLGAPGAPAAVIEGAGSTDALGSAVAPAGDVDGDGFADVAIAAPGAGTNDRGVVYVLRDLHAPQALDLSFGLPPATGYELDAPTPSHMGTSLSDLGDLDADGRHDLLTGAPQGDPPYIPDGGFAYVQFAAPLPSVVTGAAHDIAATAATTAAAVTPSSQATSVHVDFGTGAALDQHSADADAGAGAVAATVQVPLSGLQPATTYRYRAVAVNASGTTSGRVLTFATPAAGAPSGGPGGTPGGTPGASTDVTAPVATIASAPCRGTKKHCRRVRSGRAAWRVLRGAVTDAAPSSGVARIEVAALARHGRACRALRARGFVKARCAARPRYVAARLTGARWRIALRALPTGTVRLRVRARDLAGNVQGRPATRTLHLSR